MPIKLDEKTISTLTSQGISEQDACYHVLRANGSVSPNAKQPQPKQANHAHKPQPKKKRRDYWTLLFIALVILFLAMKYMVYTIIVLALTLGFIVLLYFRNKRFKIYVNNKFARLKAKLKI